MKLKFRKVLFVLPFVCSILFSDVYGNTSRDMGPEPQLNNKKINQWILFYTNIERVKKGLEPLQYDEILSKAAAWQSRYCKKIGNLSHYSKVSGMRTPRDRVVKFGGNVRTTGENVIVEFTSNVANRKYYIRRDSKGTYKDYGNYEVYWFNERQLAAVMLKSWMNSPNHRANILRNRFFAMGAGVAKGKYSGEKSYYGCQVFSGKRNPEFQKIKISGPSGKGRGFSIEYNGKFKVVVISLGRDNKVINHKVSKKNGNYYFSTNRKKHYVCLKDNTTDILYPVKVIK